MAEIKDTCLSWIFSPKRLKPAFFLCRDSNIKRGQAKAIISTIFPINGKPNYTCSENQTVVDTAKEQIKVKYHAFKGIEVTRSNKIFNPYTLISKCMS